MTIWPVLGRRTLSLCAGGFSAVLGLGAVAALVWADAAWLLAALFLVSTGVSVVLAKSGHNALQLMRESLATPPPSVQPVVQPAGLSYTPGEPLDMLRRDIQRDVAALLSLHALLPVTGSMPAPGGWAATPETLLVLVSRILAAPHIDTVVECGSGTSTAWLALALKKRGEGRLISLEHDQDYADTTRRKLEELGLDGWVEIRVNDLVLQPLEARSRLWFPAEALAGIGPVSLLFVDGPPAHLGAEIRYPALPLLTDRLTPDAWVILDDIDRAEEQSILARWVADGTGPAPFQVRFQTDRAAVLERVR